MNFKISQNGKLAVISSELNKLDASAAPELKSECVMLNKQGINNLIIDLSKTKYCDSSGLSAILAANRLCKDSSGKFCLCGLQENVTKMIRIAQLDKVLCITDNLELAKAEITD